MYTVHVLPWWPLFSESRECVGPVLYVFFPSATIVTAQELSCCQVLVALFMDFKEKRYLWKMMEIGRKLPVLA